MALTFEIGQSGGPPPGIYRGVFKDCEPFEHVEFGEGLRWIFEIETGEHAGETATRVTGLRPTPRNAAGRVIAGITGRPVAAGQKLDLMPFVGRSYLVQVEETKTGSTRVATIMTPAEGGAQ